MSTNTAIAYIRVSTDDQTLGPEAQRSAIEAWAAREGVQVTAWHVDHGVSGAAPLDRRPGLTAALGALERGAVLVAAKRDRLARDVVAAAMIERLAAKAGASVVTADGVGSGDGPEAALMRSIVDAFAQYERAVIRGRTRAALAAKRARGERTGGVRLGQRLAADGVRVEADPTEQLAIERVLELHASGVSQRAIVDRLNAEGVACRGARWHRSGVARVLAREAG
jgi:DNA invertase Pin-like site-specific DNA recombinase